MSDPMSMGATTRSTRGGLQLTISDRCDADGFEAQLDGQVVGRQPYRRYRGHIVLLATEVAEAWRELGISSALIDGVLELVRAAKATVVPRCKVAADYILRHPEHQDLVPERYRSLLQPISRPGLRPQAQ
jgi:predicted GNAT family acetyltransferase